MEQENLNEEAVNEGPIINVLYVDDEENNLQAFRASFRREFNVFTAISALASKEILNSNEIHILITDQRMPDTLGTELLAEMVKENPDQIRILLTGYSDLSAIKDAINRGQIYQYLEKPWKEEDLKKVIIEAYGVYKLKKEQKTLMTQLMSVNEKLEFILRQKLLT